MNKPGSNPERQTLRALQIIGTLTPGDFEELACKTVVEEYAAGRRLFLRGRHDQWTYYLLQGRLQLDGADGGSEILIGGTAAAAAPVANAQPREASATALERIRFIRIDNNLLEVLSHSAGPESYRVEEVQADDTAAQNRLFYAIYRDYLDDKLHLPQLPDVALKVREAVQNPDCDAAHVARIIQADPVLAAHLVQAANSPLYGTQTPINSCRAVVMFLGLNTTRDLVLTYTLRELFRTDSPLLRERMGALWRHSALVGAVSFVLAGMTAGLDKDRALLAGLLHDIGALPVIHYATGEPELAAEAAPLEQSIRALRGQVGAMVLRRWQFGSEMVGVALEAEDWQRDPANGADYTDVVIIAQRLLDMTLDEEGMAQLTALPAHHKVARGKLDVELAAEVLQEARNDVADMLQLMG